MDRLDRRTFLAGGIRLGTTLAVAGVVVDGAIRASGHQVDGSDDPASASVHRGPGPPSGQTAIGITEPVGVDPDRVLVRLAHQRPTPWCRAERVPDRGHRAGGRHIDGVGFGPGDHRRPGLRGLWRATAVRRFPLPLDGEHGGRRWRVEWAERPRRLRHRAAHRRLEALWLRPGPAGPGEEAYTYLRTTEALPTGHDRLGHRVRGRRPQIPAVGERLVSTPVRASASPTSSTTRLPTSLRRWCRPVPTPSASSTTGTGPGRGRPDLGPRPAGPGGRPLRRRQGGDHAIRRFVADPARRSGWPRRSATTTAGDFVEWIDGRLVPDRVVGRRTSTTGPGHPPRCSGRWAPHPSPISSPSAPGSPRTRSPVVTPHPGRRIGGRRLRQGLRRPADRLVPSGDRRAPGGDARRLHRSTPTVRSRPPTTPRAPISHSPTSSDPVPRTSSPTGTSGSVTCRSTTRGRPSNGTRSTLFARHATMPDLPAATFASSDPMLDAVWELCAHSGLYTARSNSSTPRPGRRARSCGMRPTSPRRSCGPTGSRT